MMPTTVPSPTAIEPLRQGDNLDSDEFERRSNAMPEVKKAQLIEGVVYMAAALRFDVHGLPHSWLMGWLANYAINTLGVLPGDNVTLRLDKDNRPQPDAILLLPASCGGQARVDSDGYIAGGPELVCEIAASSLGSDRTTKMRTYRRHHVREYLLWNVEGQQIEWLILREGNYVPLPVQPDGSLRSEVFPGLWLDPVALIALDPVRVVAMLQQGLATPEHAAFVERLGERSQP